jgi:hypothetical protein
MEAEYSKNNIGFKWFQNQGSCVHEMYENFEEKRFNLKGVY